MCVAGIKKSSIHEQNNKLVTSIEAANEIKKRSQKNNRRKQATANKTN